jgi:hypothetical protein
MITNASSEVPPRKLRRDIGQGSNAKPSSTISCPVGTFSGSDRAVDWVASSAKEIVRRYRDIRQTGPIPAVQR